MRILITGSNPERRAKIVSSILNTWPMYSSPAKTIDEEIPWPEDSKSLEEVKENFNETEQEMFARLALIWSQQDEYKDENFIVYNGGSPDILINSVFLCEVGLVSPAFVEKVIYHHKRLLHNIDIVYWVKGYDDDIEEIEDEDDRKIEMIYGNLYQNYINNFQDSIFFDQKDTPPYVLLETDNPIGEIRDIMDQNGNLVDDKNNDLLDMKKIAAVLKNQKLIEAVKLSMEKSRIPIIGGKAKSSGIELV